MIHGLKDTCDQRCTRSWRARRSHVWCSSAVTRPTPLNSVEQNIIFYIEIVTWQCNQNKKISICADYLQRCLDQSPRPPWERKGSDSEFDGKTFNRGDETRSNRKTNSYDRMPSLTVCSWRTAWAWCPLRRSTQWRRRLGGWLKTSSDGRKSPCLG